MFLCGLFGVYCPTREFFTHIETWGFFSVPHLLLLGASVYNGFLRGPVTPTTTGFFRAFSSWAATTCFYDVGLSRLWFEQPNFRLFIYICSKNWNTHLYIFLLQKSYSIQYKNMHFMKNCPPPINGWMCCKACSS